MKDVHKKGLEAVDKLFDRTTAEEFERDYLAAENGLGVTVDDSFYKVYGKYGIGEDFVYESIKKEVS